MNSTDPTKNNPPANKRVVLAETPDYVLFAIAVFIWLVPITLVGTFQRSLPGVGVYANDMFRVAALFTTSLQRSVVFYVQIESGDYVTWETLNLRDYGKIIMSGNRTRLDRMLADSIQSPRGMRQRQQLAEFIKRKYESENPEAAKIESLRYLVVLFPVGEKMAAQPGRWRNPSLESAPPEQWNEISQHFFDGRSPVDLMQPQPKPPEKEAPYLDLPELDLPDLPEQ